MFVIVLVLPLAVSPVVSLVVVVINLVNVVLLAIVVWAVGALVNGNGVFANVEVVGIVLVTSIFMYIHHNNDNNNNSYMCAVNRCNQNGATQVHWQVF